MQSPEVIAEIAGYSRAAIANQVGATLSVVNGILRRRGVRIVPAPPRSQPGRVRQRDNTAVVFEFELDPDRDGVSWEDLSPRGPAAGRCTAGGGAGPRRRPAHRTVQSTMHAPTPIPGAGTGTRHSATAVRGLVMGAACPLTASTARLSWDWRLRFRLADSPAWV
jgi:hypothetical protein